MAVLRNPPSSYVTFDALTYNSPRYTQAACGLQRVKHNSTAHAGHGKQSAEIQVDSITVTSVSVGDYKSHADRAEIVLQG